MHLVSLLVLGADNAGLSSGSRLAAGLALQDFAAGAGILQQAVKIDASWVTDVFCAVLARRCSVSAFAGLSC